MSAGSAPSAEAAGDLRETLDQLDSELASMFDPATAVWDPSAPILAPPKIEDAEPEDLLVELIED
jgi:hypothetical protein